MPVKIPAKYYLAPWPFYCKIVCPPRYRVRKNQKNLTAVPMNESRVSCCWVARSCSICPASRTVRRRHSERPEESPNLERRSCADLSALAPFVRSWFREYVYPFSVPPSAKLERRVEVAKLNCVQVPVGRQRDPARPPEAARRSPYRYRCRSSVLPRPSRRLPLRFERGGRALGVPAWTEVRLSQETGTEPETEPRRRTLDEYPSVE